MGYTLHGHVSMMTVLFRKVASTQFYFERWLQHSFISKGGFNTVLFRKVASTQFYFERWLQHSFTFESWLQHSFTFESWLQHSFTFESWLQHSFTFDRWLQHSFTFERWISKLVSHWDATISRLDGDKGLRYIYVTFCHFSYCGHTGLCDRDIYSIILTTLARLS